jgi:hypothetical protein
VLPDTSDDILRREIRQLEILAADVYHKSSVMMTFRGEQFLSKCSPQDVIVWQNFFGGRQERELFPV